VLEAAVMFYFEMLLCKTRSGWKQQQKTITWTSKRYKISHIGSDRGS